MNFAKRRRLIVDVDVQSALLGRVILYWITFVVAVLLMQFCWVVFTSRPTSSFELLRRALSGCGPALAASFLLLPLIMVDCLRLSRRFVGPVLRIRRAMHEAALGQPPQPIQLRRDDFWHDLAEDFNRLAARREQEQDRPELETAST